MINIHEVNNSVFRYFPPLRLWLTTLYCTIGMFILSVQAAAHTSTMEYYYYNHQGSLLEVYEGETNKRLLSQAWSPWGERQVLHAAVPAGNNSESQLFTQGLPTHMGYTGHKELLATGLAFAGDTRLYDARLKRFLNSDDRTTGGIRGQNRYSYAYNNPMAFIDPDGRSPSSLLSRTVETALSASSRFGRRFRLSIRRGAAITLPSTTTTGVLATVEESNRFIEAVTSMMGFMATGLTITGWSINSVPMLVAARPVIATTMRVHHSYYNEAPYDLSYALKTYMVGSLPLIAHSFFGGNILDPSIAIAIASLVSGIGIYAADKLFLATKHYFSVPGIMERANGQTTQVLQLSGAMLAHSIFVAGSAIWGNYLASQVNDDFRLSSVNTLSISLYPGVYFYTEMLKIALQGGLSTFSTLALVGLVTTGYGSSAVMLSPIINEINTAFTHYNMTVDQVAGATSGLLVNGTHQILP